MTERKIIVTKSENPQTGFVRFCATDYLTNDKTTWLYFVELAEPENTRIFDEAVAEVISHRKEKFGVLSSEMKSLQLVFDIVNSGKVLTQEVVRNICSASY